MTLLQHLKRLLDPLNPQPVILDNDTYDGFESIGECLEAFEDSRYDTDPTYRDKVLEKLERSDIGF